MTRLNILLILFYPMLFACGHKHSSNLGDRINKININNTILTKQLSFDTSRIAFPLIDSTSSWLIEDATALNLTNQDLTVIDELLSDCIKNHNSKQDTTKEFYEYITINNYKRQYVPFINSKGEKIIYVNCFCISNSYDFDYWKKSLVFVYDGGSCFFNVTINLSRHVFEEFSTNGYASNLIPTKLLPTRGFAPAGRDGNMLSLPILFSSSPGETAPDQLYFLTCSVNN